MSKFNSLLAGSSMKKAVAGFFAAATIISFSATTVHAHDFAPIRSEPVSQVIWGQGDGVPYAISATRAIWGEEDLEDFFGPVYRAIWGEDTSFLSIARAIWGEDYSVFVPIADPVFGLPIYASQVLWSDCDCGGACIVDCDGDGDGVCGCTVPTPDPDPTPEPEPDPDPAP